MCQREIFHLERVRKRSIEARHTRGWCFEMKETFLVDERDDFTAETARLRCFVNDDDAACLLDALDDRIDIERPERAQIQNLALDSLLRCFVGSSERFVEHRSPGDDSDVLAF